MDVDIPKSTEDHFPSQQLKRNNDLMARQKKICRKTVGHIFEVAEQTVFLIHNEHGHPISPFSFKVRSSLDHMWYLMCVFHGKKKQIQLPTFDA